MDEPATLREELHRLELALAARDPAGLTGGLGSLIADDFIEHGLSGRTWDAEATRELVTTASRVPNLRLLDFAVAVIEPGVAVATYRTGEPRPSRRASVWTMDGGRWVIRFHLGETAAAGDPPGDPADVAVILARWRAERPAVRAPEA